MTLFDLTGKVAIVTGGSGALGSSIAEHLVKNGVKVVILNRKEEATKATVAHLKKSSPDVLGYPCSVLDQHELERIAQDIQAKWGHIDILINAAGGNMPGATIAPTQTFFDLKMDDFRQVVDLNLTGTVVPTMVFAKYMSQQGTGNIINISSMAAMDAMTRVVGYSAAKAAVSNFTQWMAMEMAMKFGEGIRVNAIAPGFFIGEQNRALLTNPNGSYTERGQKVINKTPMGRFGQINELNGAVHFLCSPAASFITGVILPIDGGFSIYSGV